MILLSASGGVIHLIDAFQGTQLHTFTVSKVKKAIIGFLAFISIIIFFVNNIWNKSYMNCGNEMKLKKWLSQWTQFMPLRKEAWYQTPEIRHLISDICHQTSEIRRPITETWHQTSDIRHLKSDVWQQTSDIKCLSLRSMAVLSSRAQERRSREIRAQSARERAAKPREK